jgi:two-component system, OmpR family, response regulator ResD
VGVKYTTYTLQVMDNTEKKILVVEDDQFLREFYQELLQAEGYLVDTAADGEVGLSKISEGGFDLILLDIMLPKRDGLQILRELKMSPSKTPNGAIVILTNLGQDKIIKDSFDLGASGYMVKSALNPNQVLSEIKNYIKISLNNKATTD